MPELGTSRPTTRDRSARAVERVLRELRALVRRRELLRRRGAPAPERERLSAEIGGLQWRLARLVQASQEHPEAV